MTMEVNSNHTLFLKKQHCKITALIVYVDDMVVTRNDPDERKALQSYLSSEFKMKDLGHLNIFLGSKCLDLIKGFSCLKENMIYICCRKLVCQHVN